VAAALHRALADSGLEGFFEADPSTIDGVALVLRRSDVPGAQALAQTLGHIPEVQARVSRLEIRIEA
jgi:hypothetical protein